MTKPRRRTVHSSMSPKGVEHSWSAVEQVKLMSAFINVAERRSGPRIVDSVLSEISTGFQAAVFTATCSKYTASGVRRSSAV